MSILCRPLILGCLHALALSCASQAPPVHAPESTRSESRASVSQGASAPKRATNPYAPTRTPNSPLYSWQSATQQRCEPVPSDKPTPEPIVIKFSGSVGIFPPIPDEVIEAEQAKAAALDTVSGADPQPVEGRSPDSIVAGMRPAFRQCFSRWLDAKADAEGSVRFALELGCAGRVQAISADVRGVDDSTLECLFTVVAPARFGPPAGGRATLQVPVVFKNASR